VLHAARYKFTAELDSERIVNIDQHLAMLREIVHVFWLRVASGGVFLRPL